MPYEKIVTLPSDASEGQTPVADGSGGFSWQVPSGGGGETWELIGEATCDADSQTFIMDKDSSGNSFSLKEVAVIIYSPAFAEGITPTGRGVGLYPGANWGRGQISIGDAPNSSEIARYELLYCKQYGAGMRLVGSWRSQNATNARGAMQLVTAAGIAPVNFDTTADDPFTFSGDAYFSGPATCIKISGYTSTAVSAGTKVKLWGIRAPQS